MFGSVPADLMHCFLLGMYEYTHQQLFSQNKIKKTILKKRTIEAMENSAELSDEENNPSTNVFSRNCIFSDTYCVCIDSICRKYGKILQQQSEHDFPCTHFKSNYTTETMKNATELPGIIIVLLMLFSSSEGERRLD